MTRTILSHVDKVGWNILCYVGFGVLPGTPLFDREKAINVQRCAMEHIRLGYTLRKSYLDVVEEPPGLASDRGGLQSVSRLRWGG